MKNIIIGIAVILAGVGIYFFVIVPAQKKKIIDNIRTKNIAVSIYGNMIKDDKYMNYLNLVGLKKLNDIANKNDQPGSDELPFLNERLAYYNQYKKTGILK